MKKRDLEAEDIKAQLFINYFLYTKYQYSKADTNYHDEGCRGGHLELMRLYYKMTTQKRVLKKELLEKLLYARKQAPSHYLLEASKTGYREAFDNEILSVESLQGDEA